ncbi:hypothetical protein NDU88_006628 [Pleurodeles waltl]|uniref:Uncharacterized protein n=1 Tax=Pleurodeles waltl TaxID=8319 RepID=A0AAV7LVF2_PLEWA|nr:hypothetical protein NDU88_006628 [Pleurodeles waltl]
MSRRCTVWREGQHGRGRKELPESAHRTLEKTHRLQRGKNRTSEKMHGLGLEKGKDRAFEKTHGLGLEREKDRSLEKMHGLERRRTGPRRKRMGCCKFSSSSGVFSLWARKLLRLRATAVPRPCHAILSAPAGFLEHQLWFRLSPPAFEDPTDSDSSQSNKSLRKRKTTKNFTSSHMQESSRSPPNPFQFNPEDSVHLRSGDWAPVQAVADYMHDKLKKSFNKEVHNRLRAECPRPEILNKVEEMPEIDARLLTFLKKFSKDPKKGIDRAWRSCQDKLLDLSGSLTNIL